MIISIAGKPGSGKTTIAKRLASVLGVSFVSTGHVFRQMAIERGMTLAEFTKLSETDPSLDQAVDDYQRQLPAQLSAFVIEGRLAFHFIPQSLKIFFDVAFPEAARRVWSAVERHERTAEDRAFDSLESVQRSLEQRAASERKRYAAQYGITDLYDPRHYDAFIDTTGLNLEQVFDQIVKLIQAKDPTIRVRPSS